MKHSSPIKGTISFLFREPTGSLIVHKKTASAGMRIQERVLQGWEIAHIGAATPWSAFVVCSMVARTRLRVHRPDTSGFSVVASTWDVSWDIIGLNRVIGTGKDVNEQEMEVRNVEREMVDGKQTVGNR